jgi:hypothetical protein
MGWTPEELWTGLKCNSSPLTRAHTWGCPVYVLDPKLQDGKKIPKWKSRARQGIFVGFSPFHSTSVPLVLNPKTQHISPQFHVIFDDDFSTVPAVADETVRNHLFEKLFDVSRERFIDPFDAGATPNLGDDVVEPPSKLLADEWLSEDELQERLRSAVPEGATASVPIVPEGVQVPLEVTPTRPPSKPPSIPPSTGPVNAPVDLPSNLPSASPTSSPTDSTARYNLRPRQAQAVSRTATVLTSMMAMQMYALSNIWDWGQLPPALANVGPSHSNRCQATKIRHGTLQEMYLLQGDWDGLGRDVCDGHTNLFSAYFDPDLSDELGSYTITNIQPHVLAAKSSVLDPDSPSFVEATQGPFQEKWWEAMELEVDTLENDLQAWELVPISSVPKTHNIIQSTWAFRIKRFPDGLVKKFKARFCVRGDMEKEGIDFFETWSPVVQWTTVRSMMILAANRGLVTAQADITAAFVHADLKEDEHIYVRQPAGFKRGDNMCLKLKKSVYGLKQAPRYFFRYLTKRLQSKEIGLKQSERDPCLFVGKSVIAVVYVDDILFFAKDDAAIQNVIDLLKAKGVAIRWEGTAEGFLGVDIERTTTASGQPQITLLQKGLTKRIITALGLDSSLSTSISTPAEAAPLPKDTNGEPASGNINYAATVGMLLYLSGHSRPDIAFAVHQVARYTFQPRRRHEQALIRIGRYLKGTKDKGLIMVPTKDPRVDCYPDADFASLYGYEDNQDPHCVRSRTGYVILAFGCPVVWRSVLQTMISQSTMESEYISLSTACKDLISVVGIIRELSVAVGLDDNFHAKLHIKIHEDNSGALALAKLEPGRMTPRSKHYALKYHWF